MTNKTASNSARDVANVLHPLTNLAMLKEKGPLIIERGKGIYVYDDQGREYIEGISGLWCAAFGFSEPELVAAAHEQMSKLPFYHNFMGRSTLPTIALAERLVAMAPFNASKVFFVNSGSEANDTQIKLIWHYNNAIGRPAKKKIISREKAYHGSTIGAGSLTGLPAFHEEFDLPIPNILHTSCPHYYRDGQPGETEEEYSTRLAIDLDKLIQREGPDTVAAFIAEPVMAAGGLLPPPVGYFEKVQEVLRRYDILFIADEVVCGFCRTGNMFGSETFGIQPDTMSLAKQLSSAYLPIAAVVIPEFIYEALVEQSRKLGIFAHGMTYGGHPVTAAVALRTMELLEERDMLNYVRSIIPRFEQRIRSLGDHPLIGDTRTAGLLGAVEIVADKSRRLPFDPERTVGKYCAAACEAEGLMARAFGDTMGLCPPLIITEPEIDEMFDRLTRALDRTEAMVRKEKLRAA